MGPINNIPTLVQVMAWRRSGDKPLSEPMIVRLPTHICVTRPQWVNSCNGIIIASERRQVTAAPLGKSPFRDWAITYDMNGASHITVGSHFFQLEFFCIWSSPPNCICIANIQGIQPVKHTNPRLCYKHTAFDVFSNTYVDVIRYVWYRIWLSANRLQYILLTSISNEDTWYTVLYAFYWCWIDKGKTATGTYEYD